MAQPSQSFQRPKNASPNRKILSNIARTPQKRNFNLPKQILAKSTRKNASRGKIFSPLKLKNDKVKRVADIRAYFEAKTTRSPRFKGGGGIIKPANSLEVRKPLVYNHQASTEKNGPYHQQNTFRNELSLSNSHRKHHPGDTTSQQHSTSTGPNLRWEGGIIEDRGLTENQ